MSFTVAALYQFTRLADPAAMRQTLADAGAARNLIGLLLVAAEGINGTLAGTREDLESFHAFLLADGHFSAQRLSWKYSHASARPFRDLRVKLKPEIVTLRVPDLDPAAQVGTYVAPKDWNDLIRQPDVLLVDTRNDYEVRIGTFENAIDPKTQNFSQFPQWVEKNLDPKKHTKVAMFCTGGIRCEKSTSLLLKQGFKDVFHLQGGILQYLEEVPKEASKWQGECFVFDTRAAVGHGLAEGDAKICFHCGQPVTLEEQALPEWDRRRKCAKCAADDGAPSARSIKRAAKRRAKSAEKRAAKRGEK